MTPPCDGYCTPITRAWTNNHAGRTHKTICSVWRYQTPTPSSACYPCNTHHATPQALRYWPGWRFCPLSTRTKKRSEVTSKNYRNYNKVCKWPLRNYFTTNVKQTRAQGVVGLPCPPWPCQQWHLSCNKGNICQTVEQPRKPMEDQRDSQVTPSYRPEAKEIQEQDLTVKRSTNQPPSNAQNNTN